MELLVSDGIYLSEEMLKELKELKELQTPEVETIDFTIVFDETIILP